MNHETLAFFLGGYDLEMQTISDLLSEHVSHSLIHDHKLAWGARVSQYATELADAVRNGLRPVLIELAVDCPLPDSSLVVDHHNERAGGNQPTSLEQVFELLQLPASQWTRWFELVAANDRGYLPEMASRGATRDEMIAIRQADRLSQGINAIEEQQATEAVSRRSSHADGNLTLIQLPHTRTAAATDQMEPLLGGPGYKNLLVGTPASVAFYGTGALIDQLRIRFPNGWWGGALPQRGYWGAQAKVDEVLPFLIGMLSQDDSQDS